VAARDNTDYLMRVEVGVVSPAMLASVRGRAPAHGDGEIPLDTRTWDEAAVVGLGYHLDPSSVLPSVPIDVWGRRPVHATELVAVSC
jgi:hypothetical protein